MGNAIVIGLPLDYINPEHTSDTYSKRPWYAMRYLYVEAITSKGGTAICIPVQTDRIEHYVDVIDGCVITGGRPDVDPALYGEERHPKLGYINEKRTNFELAVIDMCYKKEKPILGICGGMQVMNVYKKGSLVQDISDQYETNIAHKQDPYDRAHPVFMKGSRFFDDGQYHVNSVHHQGIKELGENLVATALCADRLIEAFEDKTHPFFVGVQWHPEFFIDTIDHQIFNRFINACKESQSLLCNPEPVRDVMPSP